ncbi:15925_t:CDS:1 [Acaulospora colombiana]|uniref:15925_t:CDS:1 n=1 Tax=Acaulospora colombiana TaxID=27376 RepID=A0ACA9LFA0_9GLOM|nr:15925_t:CDS:1 [Acaulospora colombiana]
MRFRNLSTSSDSDDTSFFKEDSNDNEYLEHFSNDTITSRSYDNKKMNMSSNGSVRSLGSSKLEGYNNIMLKIPSNESIRFPKSPASENYSDDTITGEGYNHNRLQKKSYEPIGLPRSPRLNDYSSSISGSITPRSNKNILPYPQNSKADFLSPRIDGYGYQPYQPPSPMLYPEKHNEKSFPSTPIKSRYDYFESQEKPSSPNKKEKRSFSLGKSFTSFVMNTRFRSLNKKPASLKHTSLKRTSLKSAFPDAQQNTPQIVYEISEAPLPTITPISPMSHQLPKDYFSEDCANDEDNRSEDIDATALTIDELHKMVLNLRKGFCQLRDEVKDLKLEIKILRGEERRMEDKVDGSGWL